MIHLIVTAIVLFSFLFQETTVQNAFLMVIGINLAGIVMILKEIRSLLDKKKK